MDLQLWKFVFFLYFSVLCQGLSFENNCSSTYDPSTGMITAQETSGTICVWKFRADTADNFVLVFMDFRSLSQLFTLCKTTYLEVKDGSSEDSPSIVGPKMCYIIQPSAEVSTKTNGMWIKLVQDSFSHNFILSAMVRIESNSKRYKTYSDKLPWMESYNRCMNEGGSLGVSYPAPSIDLEQEVFQSSLPMWTGKSVTNWVWLLGCVTWNNEDGTQAAYHHSKYNQISECATMCKGSLFFLLQAKSCYCFKETISIETVEFRKCNFSCPGNQVEKCGGMNTFTQYQFRILPVKQDNDGTKNCAALTQSGDYVARACDLLLPFSCSFNNDTQTYTMALSWNGAVDFCSKQEGSLGLSTVPQISSDFFEEPMWLGLIRGIDWGYPSVIKRNPEKAFIAAEGLFGNLYSTYFEKLTNTSHSYPFVCQFDRVTCGANLTALDGNITSPNYPNPYGLNKNCVWTISTQAELVFLIEFQHFDVESSLDCMYDFLQFTQVLSADVRVVSPKHCGGKPPAPFVAPTNHIEVTFRSDRSVTSSGFAFTWKLVNEAEAKMWEEDHKKPKMVNGGLVIGVTIATTFLVIIVLCAVFVTYRARKKRLEVIHEPKASSVNNALYGMDGSEFDDTSVVNDNFRQYENVSSPTKLLKEEVSYNYENVEGNSIAVGVTTADITNTQSKENLVMEVSDNEEPETPSGNSKDSKTNPENISDGIVEGPFLSMSDVENMGKDAIQVVDTAALIVDDPTDDYVPIEHDMKKTNLKNEPTDSLYTKINKDGTDANEYQNTEIGAGAGKEAVNQNYDELYVDNDGNDGNDGNDEEYEDMDGNVYPILSPGHDTHGPLIPQISNVYAEIEETSQLKK